MPNAGLRSASLSRLETPPSPVRPGRESSSVRRAEPLPRRVREVDHDTITGHEMLASPRATPHRKEVQAFQAECRGFETRLPLQTQASMCAARTGEGLLRLIGPVSGQ